MANLLEHRGHGGGVVTKQRPDVLFGADSGQVRESIAAAVAHAVNEAAGSLRLIRRWCDQTEANTQEWLDAHNPDCECGVGEARLEDVAAVRALLPPVPEPVADTDT